MKQLFITLFTLVGSVALAHHTEPTLKDSVIVNVGEKSRIILYGETKEDLRKLLRYDINSILRDLRGKIDSTSNGKVVVEEQNSKKYENRQIAEETIGGKKYKVIIDNDQIVLEKTRQTANGETTDRTVIGKVDTLKNAEKGEKIKEGISVKIGEKKPREWYSDKKDNFVVSLGLNAYAQNNLQSPYKSEDYDLRPTGSRYVSLGFYRKGTIIKGEQTALRIRSGFEFSWYNLMFDGDNVATKGSTRTEFPNYAQSLSKSKLTVAYITVPFMIAPTFRKGSITHIGLGGYAGYRIDSYTKIKEANGKKDHKHANFNLNDWRYGLMAEIGFRKSVDIFAQYDLNELFKANQGPKVQVVSFGVRFH